MSLFNIVVTDGMREYVAGLKSKMRKATALKSRYYNYNYEEDQPAVEDPAEFREKPARFNWEMPDTPPRDGLASLQTRVETQMPLRADEGTVGPFAHNVPSLRHESAVSHVSESRPSSGADIAGDTEGAEETSVCSAVSPQSKPSEKEDADDTEGRHRPRSKAKKRKNSGSSQQDSGESSHKKPKED